MAARRIGFGADEDEAGNTARRGLSKAYLFLLIPLAFVAIGGWMLIDSLQFSGVALPADGTVISVEADSSGDGVTYQPTIRYTGIDGITREAPTHISSSGYDYRIGTRVEILYDPAAPATVRINGLLSLWALPVGFSVLGLLLFVVFLAAMLRAARDTTPAGPDAKAMRP